MGMKYDKLTKKECLNQIQPRPQGFTPIYYIREQQQQQQLRLYLMSITLQIASIEKLIQIDRKMRINPEG